jgi:hypothetical protein
MLKTPMPAWHGLEMAVLEALDPLRLFIGHLTGR